MKVYVVYIEDYYGYFRGLFGAFSTEEKAEEVAESRQYVAGYSRNKLTYWIEPMDIDEPAVTLIAGN